MSEVDVEVLNSSLNCYINKFVDILAIVVVPTFKMEWEDTKLQKVNESENGSSSKLRKSCESQSGLHLFERIPVVAASLIETKERI